MNKIIIKFLSLLTFFIITSCVNTNDIDVINKEKMVSILIEMHLTEESVMELKLPEDTSETFFTEKEKEIFRKYKVDEDNSVNQESLNDIHDFIEKSVQYIFNKKDDK